MSFAGGPLNHFALQSLVRMGQLLRAEPGSTGLVTAVSGVLTKQGVSLWSSEPGAAPFAHDDVSEATRRETGAVEIVDAAPGPATIATYTVVYEGSEPKRAVLIADGADGKRMLVSSGEAAFVEAATREEFCGRAVRIAAGGEASAA